MINTLNKCYIIPSCNCFSKAVCCVFCVPNVKRGFKGSWESRIFFYNRALYEPYSSLYQWWLNNEKSANCICFPLKSTPERLLHRDWGRFWHGLCRREKWSAFNGLDFGLSNSVKEAFIFVSARWIIWTQWYIIQRTKLPLELMFNDFVKMQNKPIWGCIWGYCGWILH